MKPLVTQHQCELTNYYLTEQFHYSTTLV